MTIELSIMNYRVVIPVKNILHIITKYGKRKYLKYVLKLIKINKGFQFLKVNLFFRIQWSPLLLHLIKITFSSLFDVILS